VMTYATNGWAALADPTRRTIFERLIERPSAVGELAAELPVSRPAVSQHLKVLKDAGLVVDKRAGKQRTTARAGKASARAWPEIRVGRSTCSDTPSCLPASADGCTSPAGRGGGASPRPQAVLDRAQGVRDVQEWRAPRPMKMGAIVSPCAPSRANHELLRI